MKYFHLIILIVSLKTTMAQNVGINSTGGNPDPSALLDLNSTSSGLLIPRMTTAQRDAISSPTLGLQVFNTTDYCLQIYNDINSSWENMHCFLNCSGAPSQPTAIAGKTTPCQNEAGVVYSISQVAGATSYTWNVPSGSTITAGQGTTAIVVDFATTNGNISVSAINACGVGTPRTLAITLQMVPSQPSTITGSTTVCQGDNGEAYSVTNVAGVSYAWSYTGGSGWSCASNCTTNSITANYSGSATSGTINVQPSNACGTGTSRTQAITVNTAPSAPTAATHTPSMTQIVWNWNTVGGATGYRWNTANDYATATDVGGTTTYTQTGLTCNTAYTLYVWAYNTCGESTVLTLNETSGACFTGCIPTANTVTQDVTSGTGAVWMDRNLGASQVATSSTDANSYGCFYQWGRLADGHEDRGSSQTTSLSGGDTPGHDDFIQGPASTHDWRTTHNDNLWQGVSGINNPCPTGYRIPTQAEWQAEDNTFSPNTSVGAFNSVLKLPLGGYRTRHGAINAVGVWGRFWTSTVISQGVWSMWIDSGQSYLNSANGGRANGLSVRCIKN